MNTHRLLVASALMAVLSACAVSASEAIPPLRSTVWQLGTDAPPGRPAVHIRLDDQASRVTGYGGCNRLMGGFTLEGPKLRFDGLASTRRACLNEGDGEDRFMAALAEVRGWRIEAGRLKLLSDSGSTLLDLRPGKSPP